MKTSFFLIVAFSIKVFSQAAPDVYYNTFEYPDMRSQFTWNGTYNAGTGPVVLGPGEGPNPPPGVFTGSANLGNGGTATLPVYVNDANTCRNGWCLRYDETTSTGGGGALYYLTLGNRLPNQTTEHLFYRQYLKFPTGYQFIFGKFQYARDYSANGVTVIIVKNCTGVCYSTGINIEVTNPSANYYCNQGSSCSVTGDNLWHSIEMELDPNGGGTDAATIRLWFDDQLVLEYCPACKQHATIAGVVNPGGIGFGQYYNPAGNAGTSVLQNQHFWMDDLAVSRQRIGGNGANEASATTLSTGILVGAQATERLRQNLSGWICIMGRQRVELNKGVDGFVVYNVLGRRIWQFNRSAYNAGSSSVSLPSHLQGVVLFQWNRTEK